MEELSYATVREALAGHAAAFRCITEYQPAGGPGDKVFPPTYEGGEYATEDRWINDEKVPCVVLDSVQSQANRMELALLDAMERGEIRLPLLVVECNAPSLLKPIRVTSLDAPHRAADAIFRDSEIQGKKFRATDLGQSLDKADIHNAAPLFGICPTGLIFGLWDSTGPRGGLGSKFQRAMTSEIVGLHAVPGVKTESRIDPLQIMVGAGPITKHKDGSWSLGAWPEDKGGKLKEKERPSVINHGNVTPTIKRGGYTISKAVQTTVLSLATLRRLRFPLEDSPTSDPEIDLAARTALAAIGLAAASLVRAQGADLRSRCQLFPSSPFVWELLDDPGTEPKRYTLPPSAGLAIAREAIDKAREAGLPWKGTITLSPSADLVELVRRSQVLAATSDTEQA